MHPLPHVTVDLLIGGAWQRLCCEMRIDRSDLNLSDIERIERVQTWSGFEDELPAHRFDRVVKHLSATHERELYDVVLDRLCDHGTDEDILRDHRAS